MKKLRNGQTELGQTLRNIKKLVKAEIEKYSGKLSLNIYGGFLIKKSRNLWEISLTALE